MSKVPNLLSVVVPVYNEASGIEGFNKSLVGELTSVKAPYEIIYVNDGSRDDSFDKLKALAARSKTIKVISLSRNFGKEIAITAGVNRARGQAIITIDGDGQHPVELIPKLVNKWSKGHKVVVGVRQAHQKERFFKRQSSKLFYWLFKRVASVKLKPGATDFRLIDRSVQQEFVKITERNRITRGLVDWLGYRQAYEKFTARPR